MLYKKIGIPTPYISNLRCTILLILQYISKKMNKSNISPEEWVGSISVLKIDTPDFWYRNQR